MVYITDFYHEKMVKWTSCLYVTETLLKTETNKRFKVTKLVRSQQQTNANYQTDSQTLDK